MSMIILMIKKRRKERRKQETSRYAVDRKNIRSNSTILSPVHRYLQCRHHNTIKLKIMDKISSGKEGPREVARESLIAISYSSPENYLPSNNLVEKTVSDGAERFRSELISISEDVQPSPSRLIKRCPATT